MNNTDQWLMEGIQPGLKIADLVEKGTLVEDVTTTDEAVITTRVFKSHDGSLIKEINVYEPLINPNNEKIQLEIDTLEPIMHTYAKENKFLEAAEIKRQIGILKTKLA